MSVARWVQPPFDGMPDPPPPPPRTPVWVQDALFGVEDLPRTADLDDPLGQRLIGLFPEVRRVRDILAGRHYGVAFAESCTGGLAAAVCTAVAGSGYVRGGVIVYSNAAKLALGVRPETLETHHAVSPEVAAELAVCTMRRPEHDTNIGIGITGLAGPTGDGSPRRIGEVYVAIAFRHDRQAADHDLKVVQLTGTGGLDRETIRARAVHMALSLIEEVARPVFGWATLATVDRPAVAHQVLVCRMQPGSPARFTPAATEPVDRGFPGPSL